MYDLDDNNDKPEAMDDVVLRCGETRPKFVAIATPPPTVSSRPPFFTGSRVYGKPTRGSDVDLVVLIEDPIVFNLLLLMCGRLPFKFYGASPAPLNIIPARTADEYDRWHAGTEHLKARREHTGVPISRTEAIKTFNTHFHSKETLEFFRSHKVSGSKKAHGREAFEEQLQGDVEASVAPMLDLLGVVPRKALAAEPTPRLPPKKSFLDTALYNGYPIFDDVEEL